MSDVRIMRQQDVLRVEPGGTTGHTLVGTGEKVAVKETKNGWSRVQAFELADAPIGWVPITSLRDPEVEIDKMSSGPAHAITVEHLARAKTLTNDSPENTLFVRETLGGALESGISVAPHFGAAEAWATLANALICDHLNRWNLEKPPNLAQAENAVQQALTIDRDLPLAHFVNGFVKRAKGDHGAALMAFDRALQLKPDFARAYAQKANELINVGRPLEAPPLVEKAIELNPRSPSLGMHYWIIGKAHFFAENYSEAIKWLEKSITLRENLWYNRLYLIGALAITGRHKPACRKVPARTNADSASYVYARRDTLCKAPCD